MTLSEQIKADMDSVENTRMHKFLTMIYEDSLTRVNNTPRKYLNLQLREWFGIQVPEDGYNEDDQEYVFYDAMLRGRTCCATFELKKLMRLDDKSSDDINKYRSFFEGRWNLRICQQTIANKTFEPDDPETRLSMMFTANGIIMMPNIWKKFLDILKVTDSSLATTDEDVATAVTWLVDNVMFQYEDKDIEEETSTEGNESVKRAYPPREAPVMEFRQEQPPASQPQCPDDPPPAFCPYDEMSDLLNRIKYQSEYGSRSTSLNKYWNDEFLRNVTALIGYDLVKNVSTKDSTLMINRIVDNFDDITNDKVVLNSIGSVLQVCKMLATSLEDDMFFDFAKFCDMVKKLYDVDLSDHGEEIKDYRYHVMAYLKGRTRKERLESSRLSK